MRGLNLLGAAWLALATLGGGCMKTSATYCASHADDPRCALVDAAVTTCQSSADCPTAAPACDTSASTCAVCYQTDDALCVGATPVCGADNQCHACTSHAECRDSATCLPGGQCADAATVAYVEPDAAGAACTRAEPCGNLTVAVATQRLYIKVATGTTTGDSVIDLKQQTVTVFADPGAVLTRTGVGPVFLVRDGADLTIYDLRITGATGSGGHGIALGNALPSVTLHRTMIVDNAGLGITTTSTDGATLTVSRSVIARNTLGGLAAFNTTFDLTNNLFVLNGNPSSTTGGVKLEPRGAANRFAFNTVADNGAASNAFAGLNCTLSFAVTSSIFAGTANNVTNCTVTHSLYETGTTGPADATNQTSVAAGFIDRSILEAPGFYRIQGTSLARNNADPAATTDVDVDGDPRPGEGRSDIGADEYVP